MTLAGDCFGVGPKLIFFMAGAFVACLDPELTGSFRRCHASRFGDCIPWKKLKTEDDCSARVRGDENSVSGWPTEPCASSNPKALELAVAPSPTLIRKQIVLGRGHR
jgi:hypothetical protein